MNEGQLTKYFVKRAKLWFKMSNKIKKALNADQQQSADKSEDDFDEEMDFSEDEEGLLVL